MPEVTIASHKWRKKTRDWSPVCDNSMKLNRTAGMVGNPSRLNGFNICQPACEICVTPYPLIGEITIPCARLALQPFMVLPAMPLDLKLPTSFECELLTTTLTSAVNSSNWLQNRCFQVGQSLTNIFAISETKNVILRGINGFYSSDWVDFGNLNVTTNYTCSEVGGQPRTWTYGTNSKTQFSVSMSFVNTSGGCGLGISVQARQKPGTGTSFGSNSNPPMGSGCDAVFRQFFSTFPVPFSPSGGFSIIDRINGTGLENIQNKSVFQSQNRFEPFRLVAGSIGCNAHLMKTSVTRNVSVVNGSIVGATFPISSSPENPWCWVMRITERNEA